MKTFARWTIFTAATALMWLAGGFLYLVLSRHYAMLQTPTIMLFAIFVAAGGTAIAAIAYASKLDEETDPELAQMAAHRVRPRPRRSP